MPIDWPPHSRSTVPLPDEVMVRCELICAGACGAHACHAFMTAAARLGLSPAQVILKTLTVPTVVQLEAVAGRDAEAAAAATAAGPEQIRVLLRVGMDRLALRIDHVDRQQAVAGKPERPREMAVPAAEHVAGDADGRTAAARESQPVRRDHVVDRAERGAGADGRGLRLRIVGHGAEHPQVDHHARALRQTLVGVSAAADQQKVRLLLRHQSTTVPTMLVFLHSARSCWREHGAGIECRLIGAELRIAWPQQQGIGGRQVWQRWERGPGASRREDDGRGDQRSRRCP